MADYLMQQCKLVKGDKIQFSWIPQKYAVTGKFLRLKDDDGWKVVRVFRPKHSASYLNERGRDYLHTREASDI